MVGLIKHIQLKVCSRCRIEKNLSEFYKKKITKDGYQNTCKQCQNEYNKEHSKEYYQNNKVKITKQRKDNKNKKHKIIIYHKITKYQQEYKKDNKVKIAKQNKEYNNSKANYNTFASQISYADPVRNVNGYLQTKCAYCGKWYYPTNLSVQNRTQALNGVKNKNGAECRLYCSEGCKRECPIYNQHVWPKGFKEATSREVQPQLRQLVFERDDYNCQKCGSTENLHCHHIEGIRWGPLESADVDKCMTVCKSCHIKIHKQVDCRYVDMQCK